MKDARIDQTEAFLAALDWGTGVASKIRREPQRLCVSERCAMYASMCMGTCVCEYGVCMCM